MLIYSNKSLIYFEKHNERVLDSSLFKSSPKAGFQEFKSFSRVRQRQGSPGVGRNTFLSIPHFCFIIVFICDLFVSRDDPLMSKETSTRTERLYVLSHDRS